MQTRNKYAMVVNKYARMVVAMINDIFGFYMMNARCKSVFCIFGFNNGRKWKSGKSGWKGVSYD